MSNESTLGLESSILELLRASNTTISCKIAEVRLANSRANTCTIKPRGIGTDQEGWSVSEKEIEVGTLEGAIILGINLLNRE